MFEAAGSWRGGRLAWVADSLVEYVILFQIFSITIPVETKTEYTPW
jgi:hypothetical protein